MVNNNLTLTQIQSLNKRMRNSRTVAMVNSELANQTKQIASLETTDLIEVKWIGEKTLKTLFDNWIKTQENLKDVDEEFLSSLNIPFLWMRGIKKFKEINK